MFHFSVSTSHLSYFLVHLYYGESLLLYKTVQTVLNNIMVNDLQEYLNFKKIQKTAFSVHFNWVLISKDFSYKGEKQI